VKILHEHCAQVGRDPSEVEVTHLGEILLGSDRGDLAERIERLRPSNVGPDRYAAKVNAGTITDHEARLRELSAAGVHTAIVSTPDLLSENTFSAFNELIDRLQ
jgi:hypothetical protein